MRRMQGHGRCSAISGPLPGTSYQLGHIIAPLVIWLIKKDESPFVDDQGRESLNFQISMSIYAIIALLLILVVIGVVLLIAVVIFDVIMVIIAAVRANTGERYRYPLCMRFVK